MDEEGAKVFNQKDGAPRNLRAWGVDVSKMQIRMTGT